MDTETVFELWTDDTGNLIESFASEADALAAVRAIERESGASALADVSLLADSADPVGPIRLIARGPNLVALAYRQHVGAAD